MVILQHIEGMYNLGMDASTSYLYAVTNEHAYEVRMNNCKYGVSLQRVAATKGKEVKTKQKENLTMISYSFRHVCSNN